MLSARRTTRRSEATQKLRDLGFAGYLESSKRNTIRTAAYHLHVIPHL
jgi:hypothetical protein